MKPPMRCAIYTRKSSEEGLEQSFNSLDAQREACEAYIKSQHHEGWRLIATRYDDGGYSGGNTDRPALKRLMADIQTGKVSVVVVYKVDRLTRSLSDFAKIVEQFDKSHVSFVSVTQQFNTTTSMGRLTLNVLLSFAQCEREVTGERIRDKIAASKKKGMWMGGTVPLGYAARDRKLVVNELEAPTVRTIFDEFLRLGSVHRLQQWLRENNIKSRSGNHFFRGALYIILRNPHCIGLIKHKKDSYPGEHQVIIQRETWEGSRHCSTTTSRAEGASRVQRKRVCLPVSSSTPLALATRRPTPTRTVAVIAITLRRRRSRRPKRAVHQPVSRRTISRRQWWVAFWIGCKTPPSCSPRFMMRRPRLHPRVSSFASWRRLPKPYKAGTSAAPQTARDS